MSFLVALQKRIEDRRAFVESCRIQIANLTALKLRAEGGLEELDSLAFIAAAEADRLARLNAALDEAEDAKAMMQGARP